MCLRSCVTEGKRDWGVGILSRRMSECKAAGVSGNLVNTDIVM